MKSSKPSAVDAELISNLHDDSFLKDTQLAGIINVSVRKLQNDRQQGGGLPYCKIGEAVRYRWGTVKEELARCVRTSTSDHGAAA